MADYTKSGGMSTAKSRRKNDAARNRALGLATRGRTKQGLDEQGLDQRSQAAELVPPARAGDQDRRGYLIIEHRRRDSGAVARALDLTAADAPAERVLPVAGPDGELFAFAVMCVTHGSEPRHFGTASQARREVKSSHKWCDACRDYLARTPAMRKKATAQIRRRNP